MTKLRGSCVVCRQEFALNRDLKVTAHVVPGTELRCPGSGKTAAKGPL